MHHGVSTSQSGGAGTLKRNGDDPFRAALLTSPLCCVTIGTQFSSADLSLLAGKSDCQPVMSSATTALELQPLHAAVLHLRSPFSHYLPAVACLCVFVFVFVCLCVCVCGGVSVWVGVFVAAVGKGQSLLPAGSTGSPAQAAAREMQRASARHIEHLRLLAPDLFRPAGG